MVYVWPVGWATRSTILTPIAERVQRPYHQAHYDKQQLIASALVALFIQLIQAGEFAVEPSGLRWAGASPRLANGSQTMRGKTARSNPQS